MSSSMATGARSIAVRWSGASRCARASTSCSTTTSSRRRAHPRARRSTSRASCREQIDPDVYDRPYYLAPGDGGEEAYAVLAAALRKTGRVGVGRVVLRSREQLAAVVEADTYRDRVLDLVRRKAKGEEIDTERAQAREPSDDLMAALEASLKGSKG
jgi:non-homologous end joining protein Ku